MGFFRDLFAHAVSVTDLKLKLAEVERERRHLQQEMRRCQARQEAVVDRVKEARRAGDPMEVDYLWDEIKAIRAEAGLVRRDARRANLEGIGLKKYIRGLERFERAKDEHSVRRLLERIRHSSLDDKLLGHELKEQEYLDELAATLESVGLEAEMAEDQDPEKERFLHALDAVIVAEERGERDVVEEREAELKAQLEEESPGPA